MNRILCLLLIILVACKNQEDANKLTISNSDSTSSAVSVKYAKGFKIANHDDYKSIEIMNPWPESEDSFKYELKNDNLPIHKIVVTSTTHIPALELLGVEDALVGFPGTDYISSEKTRKRIDLGFVKDLGKNEGLNTEIILDLNPDIVIGYGLDGVNKTFETIEKSGITVIYNGDWVEESPLAKAEWIKLFGVLFNKEKIADSIFNSIEKSYLEAKSIAKQATSSPTILSGAMHKDVWYAPKGSSVEGQYLKDANTNYLWEETTGTGSLAISFEAVLVKGKEADIWLSPSYFSGYEQLQKANNHYAQFNAFNNKSIFTFSNTLGEMGGVLYYELGIARPDLVLKDIIKICHPELLPNYQPYFFKPFE